VRLRSALDGLSFDHLAHLLVLKGDWMSDQPSIPESVKQELDSLRRRVEELGAFQQSDERMRLSLEGSDVGLWDWNVSTGEVVSVRHWAEILGYAPKEIESSFPAWQQYVHPDDRAWVMRAMQDHLEGRTPFYETVHRLRAKSGEWRWVLERGKVIGRDAAGTPLRVVGMLADVTTQKRAQEALQREQQLLKAMLELQERERRLVAYEIHDGFVQEVTGALLQIQNYQRLHDQNAPEARQALELGMELLRDSIDEARRLINGLRPPILDESGVLSAVDYLVGEVARLSGLTIEFRHDVQFSRLPLPLESAIFRIIQEGLTNARRHSHAQRVEVRLSQIHDRIRIEIEDWGQGFDPDQIPPHHYGLEGIRERARLFGGQALIRSAPGQGTLISVDLPMVDELGGASPI
jgi:two-component system sensor histidine kinase UhpB